ncbi:amidohydrolase family protein [Vibrio hibernica]|uniref:amidohydrolase family protein n=1 Tax=Vibrio hibernica TaxID=2587465 RepID=UPI0018830942|nr:amidohydrolase family protein [Vibrio hibernica]
MAHSRTREDGTDTQLSKEARGVAGSRITLLESYWMGTVGGAQVLDIPAGQFKPGYYFDALCISTSQANSDITIYHEFDSPRDVFEKLIAYASSHNIIKTWVNGKLVQSRN